MTREGDRFETSARIEMIKAMRAHYNKPNQLKRLLSWLHVAWLKFLLNFVFRFMKRP